MTVPLPPTPSPYTFSEPVQQSIFTVADLILEVTRQFGDEATVQINQTDIIRWINMGLVEIARNNKVWEKTAQILSVVPDFTITGLDPDRYMIALPNDCSMLQAVRYGDNLLSGFDFEQLMVSVNGSMNVIGHPTCYYMWSGGLGLYPYPDTAGIVITIYYRGTPPFVSKPAELIPLPDKYFDTLEAYVMAKAYELDEDWQAHGTKIGEYSKGINTLSEETDMYAGDFYTVTDPIYETPGGW